MKAKILVVDDEQDVLDFVVPTLEKEGYEVITARDGEEALTKWKEDLPHLIVLDITMPGMSGIDVLRKIREEEADDKNTPIVMLTSHDEILQKQNAIKWGASQYVAKSEREILRNWVNAELKQLRQSQLKCEDLRINFDAMQVNVKRDGKWKEVHLEPIERGLLFFLARRAGKAQNKEILQKELTVSENTLVTRVSTLRRKIEPVPQEPKYIMLVGGMGYRFDA